MILFSVNSYSFFTAQLKYHFLRGPPLTFLTRSCPPSPAFVSLCASYHSYKVTFLSMVKHGLLVHAHMGNATLGHLQPCLAHSKGSVNVCFMHMEPSQPLWTLFQVITFLADMETFPIMRTFSRSWPILLGDGAGG